MKKLINLIVLTIALAVVFVGCGNPAIPLDQDDGETVEQFLDKLVAFGAGVTEDGTMKVTFVKKDISVYESEYKKENGIWKTLSEEDEINYRIKKISNGIYGISGDGKIQILLEMKENSLIYRDPENPNTKYYEFIRSESEKDDGETVEQFLDKLVAFGAGVTEDGTMKVTFVKKDISVYESEYKKENGIWKTLSEEDEINYRIKKISNGIYGISGDGKIQILLEMKENSLIYRDPENPNTNYYEFIRFESEKDDGETVEQFIQRLIDFKEGITADNSVKFTFGTYNSVFAFKFYIKKDGEFVTEIQDENAFKLSKLEKVSNNLFVYDKNTMWFSLSDNRLTVKLADDEEIKKCFGNPENNTLVLIMSNN